MIILDTHIWIWWINDELQLLASGRQQHLANADVVAVSAISCFEVAWLERHRRISLPCQPAEWFEKAKFIRPLEAGKQDPSLHSG